MRKTLLKIPRNGGEETRLELAEYNGKHFINCRIWYNRGGGEMAPTPKGVTVPLEALPAFVSAAQEALTLVQSEGLVEGQTGQPE